MRNEVTCLIIYYYGILAIAGEKTITVHSALKGRPHSMQYKGCNLLRAGCICPEPTAKLLEPHTEGLWTNTPVTRHSSIISFAECDNGQYKTSSVTAPLMPITLSTFSGRLKDIPKVQYSGHCTAIEECLKCTLKTFSPNSSSFVLAVTCNKLAHS